MTDIQKPTTTADCVEAAVYAAVYAATLVTGKPPPSSSYYEMAKTVAVEASSKAREGFEKKAKGGWIR